MAWRRPGDKPLSEPMMVRLPTHICAARPQWVNWTKVDLPSIWSCGVELIFPYRQNGHHFTDHDFSCILVTEKFCTLIEISMMLEMAWRTRPLQYVLIEGLVTPTPIRECNGLRGENRGPFKGQQPLASNSLMHWSLFLRVKLTITQHLFR